ncbi:MAG: cupin domain-containing protein [Thermodesulfobacteriaceae bacterium]|nr:cupin domain-containing protein [Thermodesulfobacteriaceae bacterium]
MGLKININELKMEKHPKFEGVKIGFVSTKERHPELSVTILEIAPNVEIPKHVHEKEIDTIFILEGEGELFLEDKWSNVCRGDIVVVAKGELHGLRTKDKPLKCYIVHAPALW